MKQQQQQQINKNKSGMRTNVVLIVSTVVVVAFLLAVVVVVAFVRVSAARHHQGQQQQREQQQQEEQKGKGGAEAALVNPGPVIVIGADEIHNAYGDNEARADAAYRGKVVQIKLQVDKVVRGSMEMSVTTDGAPCLVWSLDPSSFDEAAKVRTGDDDWRVTVRGVCVGRRPSHRNFLGYEVHFERAVIVGQGR